MTLTELPQVQALSVREKLELVDEMWQSVSASLEEAEIPEEERVLLDSRWADFLRDPSAALSIDEFKSKIHTLRA